MLNSTSFEDRYCIYNITNNEEILKAFAKSGFYFETTDGNDKISNVQMMLFINKHTFLPESIQLEVEREITTYDEYGRENIVKENSSFYLKAQAYNSNVKIDLP